MFDIDVNNWAVLVSAVSAMVLGTVWYRVFATPWMALARPGETNQEMSGAGIGYLIAAGASLLTAYVLAHVVGYVEAVEVFDGAVTGVWMWLGFVGTTMASNYVFSGKPLKLYLIDAPYFLVQLVIMGAILGGWQ